MKLRNKKFNYKSFVIIFLLLLFTVFIMNGLHNTLTTTKYTIVNEKLPADFDNYRIVQISDFHGASFGEKESDLIDAIASCNPDMIVITGDMIDASHTVNLNNVEYLLAGIKDLAPIYSVNGNHEFDYLERYDSLCSLYKKYNVQQMDGTNVTIHKGNSHINLYGVETLVFGNHSSKPKETPPIVDPKEYNILLHHYSNYFDSTSTWGFDLVISGHAHGGVIRLPLIGGLLGTDAHLFPHYDKGIFTKNHSTMVSSSGLGECDYPRFRNDPEVVCITLKCK